MGCIRWHHFCSQMPFFATLIPQCVLFQSKALTERVVFFSPAHRHPLPPWRGDDRKLHNRMQRIGSLGCLLDAWASLPRAEDQEPPQALHICALPGERESGSPGQRQRQAGWRGAPVAPSALPQCLFQQRPGRRSGLSRRGDAPERGLRIPAHVPFCSHPQTRDLPVRNRLVHKQRKATPTSEEEREKNRLSTF